MMLKTKRNIGIINAITMLAVNVIYMIAVAVNGMSFIAFAGFEVPIDANLMVLLYLFSLILNMVAYAFFKRELTKKNKLILTLALLVNAILGMSGVISVLSIMSLFLINSNYDSDKEVEDEKFYDFYNQLPIRQNTIEKKGNIKTRKEG